MKKLLFILLIIGLSSPEVWAQASINQVSANGKTNTNSNTIAEEDLISEFTAITSIANLMQTATDANHVANIRIDGENNTASITQYQSNNTGAINIAGNNNTSTLLQDGTNLLSLITISGDRNHLDMNQSGNNLGNLVQVDGSGIDVDLMQNESGFRYMQQGAATPLLITSTSSYVPIIIKNN